MNTLSATNRVRIGFLTLVCILVAVAWMTMNRSEKITNSFNEIVDNHALAANAANRALRDSLSHELGGMASPPEMAAALSDDSATILPLMGEIGHTLDCDEERAVFATVQNARAAYGASREKALALLTKDKKPDEARRVMVRETEPLLEKCQSAWTTLLEFEVSQINREALTARSRNTGTVGTMFVLILAAVIAAIIVAAVTSKGLAREVAAREEAQFALHDLTRRQIDDDRSRKTALLEALVNSTPDAILIVSAEGKKVLQNRRFTELLRIPRHIAEDLDDAAQLQFVTQSASDPEKFLYKVKYLTDHPEESSHEEIEFKDGRVLDRSSAPVMGRNSEYYGRLWSFRDITERNNRSKQLRLQTMALEAAANGIVITDRAGRVVWANPAFTRLTGYAVEEAIGKTLAILKSGKHDKAFYDALWGTIQAGRIWRGELVNRRKDGDLYYEEMTVTPVCDEMGIIQNFIAIKQDISRRKRNEAIMREREESFRALSDNVPDAVARIDRELRFVYGNRALARDLGLEPAQFLGKTGEELKLPPAEMWRPQVERVFQSGKTVTFEFEFPRPDGMRNGEARLVPEFSGNGQVEFVLAITRDVTERRQQELERQRMEVQLRQAHKLEAVGQLAAGIAHELNTPIQYVADNTRFLQDSFGEIQAILLGCGELLAEAGESALTPEQRTRAEGLLKSADCDYLLKQIPAAIKQSLEGVDRVAKIVRAMKEFSHPGAKDKTTANLNRAVETTVTVARNEWKYVADMQLDLDPNLPQVLCFIGEFNQVILNLIVNAAHAIGDKIKETPGVKGLITIQTRGDGDFVEVRVSDTGSGIPEAVRGRIFEPFFTTKEVGKGTGQGLSMVYGSVVKKHGGSVTFETETGRGTTFIVRLPVLGAKQTAAAPAEIAVA